MERRSLKKEPIKYQEPNDMNINDTKEQNEKNTNETETKSNMECRNIPIEEEGWEHSPEEVTEFKMNKNFLRKNWLNTKVMKLIGILSTKNENDSSIKQDTQEKEIEKEKEKEEENELEELTNTENGNYYKIMIIKKKNYVIGNYILITKVGQGTFGSVHVGIHVNTKEMVAIKVLNKQKLLQVMNYEQIVKEIKVHTKVNHNHICKLFEVHENENKVYMILEYLSNGTLLNYIYNTNFISEDQCRIIFRQLLSALEFLHEHNIVHRDLKPENILLDFNNDIKLIDFGLSAFYKKDQMLNTTCGSPFFTAPEIILGQKYKPELVDVWSCGIILFFLLHQRLPFDDCDVNKLFHKIVKGELQFDPYVSPSSRNLLQNMLNVNPEKRYSFKDIKDHAWLKNVHLKICSNSPTDHTQKNISPIPKGEIKKEQEINKEHKEGETTKEENIKCLIGCNLINCNTCLYKLLFQNEIYYKLIINKIHNMTKIDVKTIIHYLNKKEANFIKTTFELLYIRTVRLLSIYNYRYSQYILKSENEYKQLENFASKETNRRILTMLRQEDPKKQQIKREQTDYSNMDDHDGMYRDNEWRNGWFRIVQKGGEYIETFYVTPDVHETTLEKNERSIHEIKENKSEENNNNNNNKKDEIMKNNGSNKSTKLETKQVKKNQYLKNYTSIFLRKQKNQTQKETFIKNKKSILDKENNKTKVEGIHHTLSYIQKKSEEDKEAHSSQEITIKQSRMKEEKEEETKYKSIEDIIRVSSEFIVFRKNSNQIDMCKSVFLYEEVENKLRNKKRKENARRIGNIYSCRTFCNVRTEIPKEFSLPVARKIHDLKKKKQNLNNVPLGTISKENKQINKSSVASKYSKLSTSCKSSKCTKIKMPKSTYKSYKTHSENNVGKCKVVITKNCKGIIPNKIQQSTKNNTLKSSKTVCKSTVTCKLINAPNRQNKIPQKTTDSKAAISQNYVKKAKSNVKQSESMNFIKKNKMIPNILNTTKTERNEKMTITEKKNRR